MKRHPAKLAAILIAALAAGCAQDGTLASLNTGSINPPDGSQQAASNPVCLTLASQIAALNKDGISDKVEKAAAKKYKMKSADLAKANELNKANAEFQAKCSSYPPPTTMAAAAPAASAPQAGATKPEVAAKTNVAKRNPPVPAQKPIAAATAPNPSTPKPSAMAPQPNAMAEQSQTASQPVAQP
jgi:hypothetical protein